MQIYKKLIYNSQQNNVFLLYYRIIGATKFITFSDSVKAMLLIFYNYKSLILSIEPSLIHEGCINGELSWIIYLTPT